MSIGQQQGAIFELVETLRRKAPAYLDLMTAESDEEFEKAFEHSWNNLWQVWKETRRILRPSTKWRFRGPLL
jgi:hypothetical protein